MMNDNNYDTRNDAQLDALLRSRAVPEMRNNLEYRIIQASLKSAESAPSRSARLADVFWEGLRSVLDSIALPHPAFAMVLVLLGGAVLGLYSGSGTGTNAQDLLTLASSGYVYTSSDVETFVMATDAMEYGDYL